MNAYIKDKNFQKVIGAVVIILLLWGSTSKDRGAHTTRQASKNQSKSKRKGQGNVDNVFFEKIQKLLKNVVPSANCKESKYLVILSLLLVLRTYMSIWLAEVNGKIVKAIVDRNFKKFMMKIFNLLLFSIPSSAVNSALDYFNKLLAISFRERIT